MKTCPNCRASNPDSARTCLECSMPLPGASSSYNEPIPSILRTSPPPLSQNTTTKSERIYESEIKPLLHYKDGFTHVVMVNSFSKWINQVFGAESKYTRQIDEIVTSMQKDGYEIIDIKFSTEQNQGIFKEMEGFYTLIMYK